MPLPKSSLVKQDLCLGKDTIDNIIRHALTEDIGKGDITTQLMIPENKKITAHFLAKAHCCICGLVVADRVFHLVDPTLAFQARVKEGACVKAGKIIAVVSGKARSILAAERVALNIVSMLSGIATKTRDYVLEIEPLKTRITDTRKTFPCLRELQKYAVRVGGGSNHRMRLDEMILIKDNHIKIMEGFTALPSVPKGVKIEIEVQSLEEFHHAIRFKPDVIMLDNMSLADIKKAVAIRNGILFNTHHPRTQLEVSGGVTLQTVKKIARTGVEIISIGDLTHSVRSADICLDVV